MSDSPVRAMEPDAQPINYSGWIVVGAPGLEIPARVLVGICEYCVARPAIEELYLYVMALLNEGAPEGPQLAIGLRLATELSPRDERALCDGLSTAAPPPNSGYSGLLVAVLHTEDQLRTVREHVAPLYRRGDPPTAWILQRKLVLPRSEGTDLAREPDSDRATGVVEFPVYTHGGFRSLPVFTSEAEFVNWQPQGGDWIALEARAVLEAFVDAMPADRIIVDNRSARAFAIDRDEARALLALDATTSTPDAPPPRT
jgi:hypothetical protein